MAPQLLNRVEEVEGHGSTPQPRVDEAKGHVLSPKPNEAKGHITLPKPIVKMTSKEQYVLSVRQIAESQA
jgi:hypothetical protein